MSDHTDKAELHAEHAGGSLSQVNATVGDYAEGRIEVLLSIGQRLAAIDETLGRIADQLERLTNAR